MGGGGEGSLCSLHLIFFKISHVNEIICSKLLHFYMIFKRGGGGASEPKGVVCVGGGGG